ncbi:MAG: hypothetical protein ABIJ15_09310 [bacterium]
MKRLLVMLLLAGLVLGNLGCRKETESDETESVETESAADSIEE